jgi:hypothetical protein
MQASTRSLGGLDIFRRSCAGEPPQQMADTSGLIQHYLEVYIRVTDWRHKGDVRRHEGIVLWDADIELPKPFCQVAISLPLVHSLFFWDILYSEEEPCT